MNPTAERLARVRLSVGLEPGQPRTAALVVEHGAEAAVAGIAAADPLAAPRLAEVDPTQVLTSAAAAGIRFLIPGDDEWPDVLADLDHAATLHERGGTPVGLWVRGPLHLAESVGSAVAIVGARSATTYGTAVAEELAHGVASAGHTVVSGAAFGIDRAAHRGALLAEGTTVAVLACGVDRYYPKAHEQLLRHLAEHGAVVSETPPGGAPMRVRFLARNRIIAALTVGTVVVEAAVRSGALNTASWADGLSRVLMGVPGPVNSATSQGVHQMLRNRAATVVTRAEEVLEAVAPMGERAAPLLRGADRPRDVLATELRLVLEAVPAGEVASWQRIARTAGLPEATTIESLEALRVAGLVEPTADPGGTAGWRLTAVARID